MGAAESTSSIARSRSARGGLAAGVRSAGVTEVAEFVKEVTMWREWGKLVIGELRANIWLAQVARIAPERRAHLFLPYAGMSPCSRP